MILTVTPNTNLDHVYVIERLVRSGHLVASETAECVGGKGGLLSAFAADLGASSVALGFAAGENARKLARLLRERGVRADFTPVQGETRCIITIVERQNVHQTLLMPVTLRCSHRNELDLMRRTERWLRRSCWLALCGSLPPGCSPHLYARLTRRARRHQVPVLIDSRGHALSFALAAGPTVVKLNVEELERTVGQQLSTRRELAQALRRVVAKGVTLAVCTLGAGGAVAVTAEAGWRVILPRVTARNAVGAGDAFAAGLLAARMKGQEWPEALRWAAAVGTAKVLELRNDGLDRAKVRSLFPRVRVENL
jgi:1-phosphofructokinase family hexose kinase